MYLLFIFGCSRLLIKVVFIIYHQYPISVIIALYLLSLEVVDVRLSRAQNLLLHQRLHPGLGSLLHHLDGVAGDVGLSHDVVLAWPRAGSVSRRCHCFVTRQRMTGKLDSDTSKNLGTA